MKRIVFSLFFLAAAFIVKAQTAEEVVNMHINAIGGAEAWKKVNSVKVEGKLQGQGFEAEVTQTVLHGKGSKQEFTLMGMTGYMTVTPNSGWNFMPFQGQTAPEAMTAESIAESQDQLDAQGILVDYVAKGHTIELLGKDDVDGTECFKLKVNKKGGRPETFLIDTKNYYLIRSISIQKANGQEMESITNFSNYEKLPEGIVMAKSLTLPFGELNLTKITINGTVDENIFKN